jgi:hypothetical protein
MIDLFIGFIALCLIIVIASCGKIVFCSRNRQRKAYEDDKSNIDPNTGEYTSKYDGLRYDKDGTRIWWK